MQGFSKSNFVLVVLALTLLCKSAKARRLFKPSKAVRINFYQNIVKYF